ncbi:MAG: hypothetical protein PHE24_05470 [Patescibacteria group bacterium]|nr:hypothetical protein [Patescibacteria group bacterium]
MENGKILAADDEMGMREIYSTLFQSAFPTHEILLAESAAGAKAFCTLSNIRLLDAVVLDGNLGDGYAWDVVDSLISYGYKGGIIVVTGGFPKAVPSDYFDRIDVTLKKPVDLDLIVSLMTHFIKPRVDERWKNQNQ